MGDLAEELGVQKGSLYSLTGSKQQLLYDTMRQGADAFHAALDQVPDDVPATERIRFALRGHLRVVAEQVDVATVFTREWRYLEGDRRLEIVAERRRYEERFRALFARRRRDGASSAPTSTRAPLLCSCSRRRTGRTRGWPPAVTPTSSPIASRRCSSTAFAATPLRAERHFAGVKLQL